MTRSTNHLVLRGRIGQTPRLFSSVAKVSIATERSIMREGGRVTETDWVTITILNKAMAQFAAQNAKAGDEVYCECRVAEGSYEKDGRTIHTTDVIANVFDLYPNAKLAEAAS